MALSFFHSPALEITLSVQNKNTRAWFKHFLQNVEEDERCAPNVEHSRRKQQRLETERGLEAERKSEAEWEPPARE